MECCDLLGASTSALTSTSTSPTPDALWTASASAFLGGCSAGRSSQTRRALARRSASTSAAICSSSTLSSQAWMRAIARASSSSGSGATAAFDFAALLCVWLYVRKCGMGALAVRGRGAEADLFWRCCWLSRSGGGFELAGAAAAAVDSGSNTRLRADDAGSRWLEDGVRCANVGICFRARLGCDQVPQRSARWISTSQLRVLHIHTYISFTWTTHERNLVGSISAVKNSRRVDMV